MTQNYLQQSDFIALKAYKTKTCETCLSNDIIPCANRKYNLGSDKYAFNEIHAKKIFVDANTLVIGGGVTLSSQGNKFLVNGKEVMSIVESWTTLLANGQLNQVLSSDGNGGLVWQNGGGGGSTGTLQTVCDNGRVYQRTDPIDFGNKVQTTTIVPSISTIDKKNATVTLSGETYSHTIDTSCFYVSDDGVTPTKETGFFFNLSKSSGNPMTDYNVFTKIIADKNNITIGGTNNGGTLGTGLSLLIANNKDLTINGTAGLANQFLMSNGPLVPPSWQTPASFLGATGTCPQNSWVSVNATNNALPSVNTQIGYTFDLPINAGFLYVGFNDVNIASKLLPPGVWIMTFTCTYTNPSTVNPLAINMFGIDIYDANMRAQQRHRNDTTSVAELVPGTPNTNSNFQLGLTTTYIATYTTPTTVFFDTQVTISQGVVNYGGPRSSIRITRIA